jgi:hypothetical protein
MSVTLTAKLIEEERRYFEAFPDIAEKAMTLAINQTVERDGLAMLKKDMRSQVNFPAGYLESEKRLNVKRRANRMRLEGVIEARDRPTSLARFAPGQTVSNTRGRGVRLMIQNGQTTIMPRAFLIKLKNGNMGLAIRLPNGQQPKKTSAAVEMLIGEKSTLWLLYGPSVEQVFRGVAEDRIEDLSEMVANQFRRQFTRLSTNG